MFQCRCTNPWLPVSTCEAHAKVKTTHTVGLIRPHRPKITTLTSEDKANLFSQGWCKDCNALKGPTHICTRHPSEPVDQRPY